ncbi:MAG: hypothetical protein ABI308_07640 [Mucilaginibacter sp.]
MSLNILRNFKPIAFLLILCFSLNAISQKLPKIQQVSVRAPTVIINGQIDQSSDDFRAYNPNNRIYYTISNDDDNLYLVLQTSDSFSNEKAIFGISFTVKKSQQNKKTNKNVVVTYPITYGTRIINPIRHIIEADRKLRKDTTYKSKKKTDSISLIANKQLNESFKEIEVAGVEGITESTVSIYNSYGIKVSAEFNNNMRYVFKLAIPLKYLNSSINSSQKLLYNIKMNGIPTITPGSPFPAPTISGNVLDLLGPDNAYVTYSTDFSGEYALAK